MKVMKSLLVGLLVGLSLVFGCNADDACYTPSQTNGGVGGNPVVTSPVGGFGDSPAPKPQASDNGGEEAPCGPEKTYQCTYHYKKGDVVCTSAGKDYACSGRIVVLTDSAATANKKCEEYASTHGATCDGNCTADDNRLWECNGTATCTASGKADKKCDYKDELVLAASKSDAANTLVNDCQTITNPGYTCKNKSIKCFDPDAN